MQLEPLSLVAYGGVMNVILRIEVLFNHCVLCPCRRNEPPEWNGFMGPDTRHISQWRVGCIYVYEISPATNNHEGKQCLSILITAPWDLNQEPASLVHNGSGQRDRGCEDD
ncbi:hypothetical protein AVEN_19896-1 [Araneus ventricosus]|uniref:Uncharacterized protein n=1 Tax=Araneus ventricosus TaxID=182803 RepID=A0A4Y2JAC8_ARAVE|nr:hypothetical protein AVEN_19896-1 [Araneus ventricosus]